MTTLPNGNPNDMEMLEVAMEDSNLTHMYYLNTQTGEVLFLSEDDDMCVLSVSPPLKLING